MIKKETIVIRNKEFVRTWSTKKVYIHGGLPEDNYTEAFDLAALDRTYKETDIPIEEDSD